MSMTSFSSLFRPRSASADMRSAGKLVATCSVVYLPAKPDCMSVTAQWKKYGLVDSLDHNNLCSINCASFKLIVSGLQAG